MTKDIRCACRKNEDANTIYQFQERMKHDVELRLLSYHTLLKLHVSFFVFLFRNATGCATFSPYVNFAWRPVQQGTQNSVRFALLSRVREQRLINNRRYCNVSYPSKTKIMPAYRAFVYLFCGACLRVICRTAIVNTRASRCIFGWMHDGYVLAHFSWASFFSNCVSGNLPNCQFNVCFYSDVRLGTVWRQEATDGAS